MRCSRYLLVICLLAAVVTPAAADGYVTSVGSGADTITVVVLSGTPYEMGYSYGSLVTDQVVGCLSGYLSMAQGSDPVIYSNANLDAAWATVEPYVKARFIEEMHGLADGAGITYDQVRRAHAVSLVSDYACSGVDVWGAGSANGDLYQIRNLDYEKEAGLQNYPVISVYLPETGIAHANVAFAGFVGSMAGMNAEGIALTEIGETPHADYPFNLNGIPFVVMFRDILQDCGSLDEALTLISSAQRIKKYYWFVGDGDAKDAAKIKSFAPSLWIWGDNDPADEVYPYVLPNVVYRTMDDAAGWTHLQNNWGDYNSTLMIALSRLVADAGGNLMNVVYDATTREMWVAYAEGSQDASQRDYVYFDLKDYLPQEPVGGYGFYEVIGSGEDQITVLHVGGTHYEIGYWHGMLLRDQVRENSANALAAAEAGGTTEADFDAAIAAMWPYVSQEYLDEMQGLADGAGLAIRDVYKMHAIPDMSEYHCSAFAAMGAATVDGHCIQLRNLDYGLELLSQNNPVIIIAEPNGRNKYANVSFAGMIGSIAGMSYEHIPVSEMGDSFDWDNETLDGEPMPFLLKDVLELAQSYSEAESIVGAAHRTSSLWYTVSDPEERRAGLMKTSPTIFDVYHLGEAPGGVLPAIPDVIYGGYYNDRLYTDLSTNWGKIDPATTIAISVNNAMNSNLMNAVFDATTLEMWVAYAEGEDRAANRPYVHYDLRWPTQPVAKIKASVRKAAVGEEVTFSGADSYHPNPNRAIVSYEWDWESDGTYDATGVTASHAFGAIGIHTVTLRVTDDFTPGNSATATLTVAAFVRPEVTSFAINGGAEATPSLATMLSITCARAAQMRFRNAGGDWSAWKPYATSSPWVLGAGVEGWRQVDAQCIDALSNASYRVSDAIYYDTAETPPTGKVVIAGGADYTTTLAVTLDLVAKGATQMRLKNRYADEWGAWIAYAPTKQWTLAAGGEGQRAVYAQFRDSHGTLSAVRADTISFDDPTPPSGRVVINGGAAYTTTRSVTLNLRATGAAKMRLKHRYADAWGDWRPYAPTTSWTLTVGPDGPRAVYAQFQDHLENVSAIVSDTIYLDTDTPPTGSIQINNGAAVTLLLGVTVNANVSGAAQMRFKSRYDDPWGEWLPYAANTPWTLTAGADGPRAVYAQFQDYVGNASATMVDTIFYDTFAAPEMRLFRINNDQERTSTLVVTLSIGASGAAEMRFKNSEAGAWSAWRPYASSASWTLLGGPSGTRTVYCQCRDYLGNLSLVRADSIILEW